jgi:hypothetical protein
LTGGIDMTRYRLMTLAVLICAMAGVGPGEITDAMRGLARARERGASADEVYSWAVALEHSVSRAADDPALPAARLALGRAYQEMGHSEEAFRHFQAVAFDSTADTSAILQASDFGALVVPQTARPVEDAFLLLDRYQEVLDRSRAAGEPLPVPRLRVGFELDRYRGMILEQCARRDFGMLAGTAPAEEAVATLSALLDAAAGYWARHLAQFDAEGVAREWGYADDHAWYLAHSAARLWSEAAGLTVQGGDQEAGRRMHGDAAQVLLALRNRHAAAFNEISTASLVTEWALSLPDFESYFNAVESLLAEIAPCPSCLAVLNSHASELSTQAARRLDSNRLFDLVLIFEERWFPRDFEQHFEYHDALVGSAQNALHLGNLDDVASRLRRLENVQLDPHLSEWRLLLQRSYIEHVGAVFDPGDNPHEVVTEEVHIGTIDAKSPVPHSGGRIQSRVERARSSGDRQASRPNPDGAGHERNTHWSGWLTGAGIGGVLVLLLVVGAYLRRAG